MEFHDFCKLLDVSLNHSLVEESNFIRLSLAQRNFLSFLEKNKYTIVYKQRQEGVSFAMSLYILWKVIVNPKFKVGVIASSHQEIQTLRQLINGNLHVLEQIFHSQGLENTILTPEKHNQKFTEFSNHSKIQYWTKKQRDAGRGYLLDFIYISELGFNDNYDDLIQSFMCCFNPTSNKSKFIITTTDLNNLKEDFFMNGDGIMEYWTDSFDGKRKVIIEKKITKYKF